MAFNEQVFEQKLTSLKDTQEAINGLSSWCLQHKEHHKSIVTSWLHCLKRVKVDQRLSLFYLANDVVQYSKRKHLDFVDSWATALQKATPLVRDEKIRDRIMRIFKIWEERGVYDEAFVADLCGLLTTTVKKKSEQINPDPAEFQPMVLVKKMRDCKVLGENTDTKLKRIKDNKLPLTDAETMRASLKDRRHGSDVAAEVDSGVRKMEAYVKALETEISAREKLIEMLHQSMIFYETQRGEAKLVANAYRSFNVRLKNQQKAIEDLLPTLLSPLPSPDVDAPSPSPDPDLDAQVPTEHHNGNELDFSFVNSSFIGSSQFIDMHKEVFGNNNMSAVAEESSGQPISVIGSSRDFNVGEFLKSLMPIQKEIVEESQLPPPPIPPPVFDWAWSQPPPVDTPQSPPGFEKQQSHHVEPVEYDDSMPVPPLTDMDHRSLTQHPSNHQEHHLPLPASDIDHRSVPHLTNPLPHLDVPPSLQHLEHSLPLLDIVPPLSLPHLDPPPHSLLEHTSHQIPTSTHLPLPLLEPPPLTLPLLEPPPSLEAQLDSSISLPLLDGPPPSLPHLDPPPHALPNLERPPPSVSHMDAGNHIDTRSPLRGVNLSRMDLSRLPPQLATDRGAVLTGPAKQDLDHRNLISLTGPHRNERYGDFGGWPGGDPRLTKDVNVESIDMDVSDDDESQLRANAESNYPSAGAKLIPPIMPDVDSLSSDRNGFGDCPPPPPPYRQPWRPSRPHRPYMNRPSFPYRQQSPHFRPRARW